MAFIMWELQFDNQTFPIFSLPSCWASILVFDVLRTDTGPAGKIKSDLIIEIEKFIDGFIFLVSLLLGSNGSSYPVKVYW